MGGSGPVCLLAAQSRWTSHGSSPCAHSWSTSGGHTPMPLLLSSFPSAATLPPLARPPPPLLPSSAAAVAPPPARPPTVLQDFVLLDGWKCARFWICSCRLFRILCCLMDGGAHHSESASAGSWRASHGYAHSFGTSSSLGYI